MTQETLDMLNIETDFQLHAIWQMPLMGWVALADELGVRCTDHYAAARMLACKVLRDRGVLPPAAEVVDITDEDDEQAVEDTAASLMTGASIERMLTGRSF